MAVTSGWDLGSEADREAGWGRTVPLGVAGVTRRGPLDEGAACWLWVVRFQGVGDGHPKRSGLGQARDIVEARDQTAWLGSKQNVPAEARQWRIGDPHLAPAPSD
jgi:hypothetical protein